MSRYIRTDYHAGRIFIPHRRRAVTIEGSCNSGYVVTIYQKQNDRAYILVCVVSVYMVGYDIDSLNKSIDVKTSSTTKCDQIQCRSQI